MITERLSFFFWIGLGWITILFWLSFLPFASAYGQLFAYLIPKPDSNQFAWALALLTFQYAPFCLSCYPVLKFFDWTIGKVNPPEDIVLKRTKEIRDIFAKISMWLGTGLLLAILLIKFG